MKPIDIVMGGIVLVIVVAWAAYPCGQQAEPYTSVVKVEHQETYDSKGIQFFAFVGPDGKDSSLLSVDADLELSQILLSHDRKHVRITIEPADPQELTK